ncbi:MAG: hypothetical protein ACFN4H_00260 [Prevotella sp.]
MKSAKKAIGNPQPHGHRFPMKWAFFAQFKRVVPCRVERKAG